MSKKIGRASWLAGTFLLTGSIALGLTGFVTRLSADGPRANYGADAALAEQYLEHCGDCHFAYPPSLLPQDSWRLTMDNLVDHFGEDAELGVVETKVIRDYLVKNSQGSLWRFAHKGAGDIPIRITELDYFLHEHEPIPRALVQGNDEVGSFSNCSSCHNTQGRRMFDDDDVNIPGYGYWDD
tara:strand:+ start:127 stop:672 length:546 start_codon:yes stop_codon:yes gene_type:complete